MSADSGTAGRHRLLAMREANEEAGRISRMGRKPMRARAVKVSDATWEAAMRKAGERGDILSEEIRKFLERYARRA